MARRALLVCALALVAAEAAGATATPRTPEAGGETTSHPAFTWTEPAGGTSEAIFVSSSPKRTPAGRFYSENLVTSDVFGDDVRTWSPDRALFAGRYWWSVETRDGDRTSYYSRPSAFVVVPAAGIRSIATQAGGAPHSLGIT